MQAICLCYTLVIMILSLFCSIYSLKLKPFKGASENCFECMKKPFHVFRKCVTGLTVFRPDSWSRDIICRAIQCITFRNSRSMFQSANNPSFRPVRYNGAQVITLACSQPSSTQTEQSIFSQSSLRSAGLERENWPRDCSLIPYINSFKSN